MVSTEANSKFGLLGLRKPRDRTVGSGLIL